ncbi:MAG: hypothetical protein ACR2JG_05120 [Geodermatophilaceae bacterium]
MRKGTLEMASMFGKISQFARSPKGQQVLRQAGAKAQQMAKDPANKAKINDVRSKIAKRRPQG